MKLVTDELGVAFKEGVIFRVLVDHHIQTLAVVRIFDIKPYFLVSLCPVVECAPFNIVPNLFKFLVCHDFSLSGTDDLVAILDDLRPVTLVPYVIQG